MLSLIVTVFEYIVAIFLGVVLGELLSDPNIHKPKLFLVWFFLIIILNSLFNLIEMFIC